MDGSSRCASCPEEATVVTVTKRRTTCSGGFILAAQFADMTAMARYRRLLRTSFHRYIHDVFGVAITRTSSSRGSIGSGEAVSSTLETRQTRKHTFATRIAVVTPNGGPLQNAILLGDCPQTVTQERVHSGDEREHEDRRKRLWLSSDKWFWTVLGRYGYVPWART